MFSFPLSAIRRAAGVGLPEIGLWPDFRTAQGAMLLVGRPMSSQTLRYLILILYGVAPFLLWCQNIQLHDLPCN